MNFPVNWPKVMSEMEAEKNAEIQRLRAALAPILAHADAPDTAPPLRISVRMARKMKEKINATM